MSYVCVSTLHNAHLHISRITLCVQKAQDPAKSDVRKNNSKTKGITYMKCYI